MKTRGNTSGNIYVNLRPINLNNNVRQRRGKNSGNLNGTNIDDDNYNYDVEENYDSSSPSIQKSVMIKSPRDFRGNFDNNAAVAKYIENCALFGVKIDTSIVISLRSGWSVMQPSNSFAPGALLPLMGILDNNIHIKKLNLSKTGVKEAYRRGNGNSNARALSSILKENYHIEELDLSDNGLDDDGIAEVATGIINNRSIKKLNLSHNHFGEKGAELLRQALEVNNTIQEIDLSKNALGFISINNLLCCCSPKGMILQTQGNFVFEEVLNATSHGLAFIGSVIGSNLLISKAVENNGTDYHFWACTLYSFALMILFLSSSLFHSFFMLPSAMKILQILDHVGIYLVIAGSYTPILLIGLHNYNSARVLLIAEWTGAILGSIFAMCSDLNAPMTTKVELSFFIIMGSGVLLILPIMISTFPTTCLYLMFGGGMSYLVGVIFFVLGEIKPIYHVIWHLFVVFAATMHWFAVYFFIANMSLDGTFSNEKIEFVFK